MQYNVQGINANKISELNLFLSQSNSKIKVISLNEHWLDNNSIHLLNNVINFNLADSYVRENSLRGGSCLLVEKSCKF